MNFLELVIFVVAHLFSLFDIICFVVLKLMAHWGMQRELRNLAQKRGTNSIVLIK